MGLIMDREQELNDIREKAKKFKKCPDKTVNEAILKFCSTSSSESLKQHLNETKERRYPVGDWLRDLTEKLADQSPNTNLAGLGVLAFAIFIDIISGSSSSESTKEDLRCVFAEEKASEVWDQIDECLKRCLMHMNDDAELVSNIRRIECQLSAALTKLKSSMVKDGQMCSRALKAWVNGAAFHIQMLIHLLRLGGLRTCDPVDRLISVCQHDLQLLFEEHRAVVVNKCRPVYPGYVFKDFYNEDGELLCVLSEMGSGFPQVFEIYYEECYMSQKNQITQYFNKVSEDLPRLLGQLGRLTV